MFLANSPLWLSAILVVGVPTLLATLGPLVIRRFVSLKTLSANNELAGFQFATVGVTYAVLLAFAVFVVWEKFSDAESNVAQEAGAAINIYRLAQGIEAEPAGALRTGLIAYLETAIAEDWPAMEKGKGSLATTRALGSLYAIVLGYKPGDQRGAAVLTEILRQLDLVTEARRARLVKASGAVPGIVWLVLFGGAVITVAFTFFFGSENLRAQTTMAAALALLIFSGLLVIVAIDHPFAGLAKVEPEALSLVLEDLGRGDKGGSLVPRRQ
jgi:hypothetical protein